MSDIEIVKAQSGAIEHADQSPHALMFAAIERVADPAVLSKLMDLQERYDASQAHKAYVAAMAAFKTEVPAVLRKDRSVDFLTKDGSHIRYNHATLGSIIAAVTPVLSKHGLSASWETKQGTGTVQVSCHITHAQGHRETVTLNGPIDESGKKNPIQQVGSSVTYLQRYTFLAACGLATAEMDDADDPTPVRKPVAMPTEQPTGHPQADAKPPPKRRTEPKREDATQASEYVEGQIRKVFTSHSKPGVKPEWTSWAAMIGDNRISTLDEPLGKTMLEAEESGDLVRVHYVVNGKYRNATCIERVEDTQSREPEQPEQVGGEDQDNLPF